MCQDTGEQDEQQEFAHKPNYRRPQASGLRAR
jgi:hypothetical protein